jgi:flagellin-like hook-associated protein FlgL
MSVRISTQQVLDSGVQAMDNSLADAMAWQQKINTGKNYNKASDNAYAMARGVRLDFDTAKLKMFTQNQNFVASSMANTDTQLGSVVNQMNSLKQLMVQSQDGSLNAVDYAALQQAAQGYLDTINQQSTALDGTGAPIFPNTGTVNQVQIEPNVMVNTAVKFTDAFGGAGSSKTNVVQKIQDFVDYLGKMAAGNNPGSTAQRSVSDGLDAAFNQLTVVQEGAGSIAKQVDNSKNATTSIGTQLQATSSALLDTDLAAATAAYTRSQTILSAAQAMFARISQSNLFSKL